MSFNSGGVTLTTQFDLKSKQPLDGRYIITNAEEYNSMKSIALYPGLTFAVKPETGESFIDDENNTIKAGFYKVGIDGVTISKLDAYTKEEVDAAIAAVEATIDGLDFSTPTATDDSNNPVTFIDTVSQMDGKISATKKTIRTATDDDTGIVKLSDATSGTETAATGKTAATPTAVKAAYNKAEEANAAAIAAANAAAHSHPYLSNTTKYAGSSSAGGAATSANKVNKALTVQLNGGTTEDTNKFVFDGSAAKAINITPAAIGAAEASLSTRVAKNESDIAALKDGIAGGVHFIGTVSAKPESSSVSITKDGTTKTVTAIAGDVVIWPAEGIEYIYTGTSWEELGDITRLGDLETKVKNLKTTATNAVATTHKFVSQVTQSAGQIEVTYTRPGATDISYNSTDSVKDKLDDIDAAVSAVEEQIPDVVDNLTTDDSTKALSAKQGKALNDELEDKVDKDTYNADKGTFATKSELTPISQTATNAATKADNLESRLDGIVASGGEPNAINTIKLNGTALPIDSQKAVNIAIKVNNTAPTVDSQKAVNISVPTKVSDLENDSGFITLAPTPNNGKLTIQKNGVDIESFTANQSEDTTINITVPIKVSELENDLNYVNSLPTASNAVFGVVKTSVAVPTTDSIGLDTYINTADDNKLVALIRPGSKNTLGYVTTTSNITDVTEYTACPVVNGVPYYSIRGLATTDFVNGQILTVDAKIPAVTNNLTSTSTVAALSAAQGKILKDAIDTVITDEEIIEMFNEE